MRGGYWNPPYTVHEDGWKIAGCPVNGPMLANHENDVAIAWYTSPNSTPTVNVAFSKDEGASFDAPLRVGFIPANWPGRLNLDK